MIPAGVGRVLVPAALTFLAGGLFGFVAGQRLGPRPEPLLDPDLAAYQEALTRELGLDPEQASNLRVVLTTYGRERRRILDAQRFALEPELSELDRRFEMMILDRVLDPAQRARAVGLMQAVPALSGNPADG